MWPSVGSKSAAALARILSAKVARSTAARHSLERLVSWSQSHRRFGDFEASFGLYSILLSNNQFPEILLLIGKKLFAFAFAVEVAGLSAGDAQRIAKHLSKVSAIRSDP
jgi:hypothetical protein